MIIHDKDWENNPVELHIGNEHTFLGECTGIALVPRGVGDGHIKGDHITYLILVEDDGNWFVSRYPVSIYWLDDLEKQIKQVKVWLKRNAVKEKNGYGYRFKSTITQ